MARRVGGALYQHATKSFREVLVEQTTTSSRHKAARDKSSLDLLAPCTKSLLRHVVLGAWR